MLGRLSSQGIMSPTSKPAATIAVSAAVPRTIHSQAIAANSPIAAATRNGGRSVHAAGRDSQASIGPTTVGQYVLTP